MRHSESLAHGRDHERVGGAIGRQHHLSRHRTNRAAVAKNPRGQLADSCGLVCFGAEEQQMRTRLRQQRDSTNHRIAPLYGMTDHPDRDQESPVNRNAERFPCRVPLLFVGRTP